MRNDPPPLSQLVPAYIADPTHTELRLGQWFMNKYMPKHVDPRLFYEKEISQAFILIGDYYIKYQWKIA